MIRWGLVMSMLACGNQPGVTCSPKEVGGPFCIPDSGRAANLDVKVQLRDTCTSPCDRGTVACFSFWDGGTEVKLALVGQACFDVNAACPALCGMKTYDCALPVLPDGTYTVTSSGQGSQTLAVGVGGSPGCKL
jgi:hypothetical protein